MMVATPLSFRSVATSSLLRRGAMPAISAITPTISSVHFSMKNNSYSRSFATTTKNDNHTLSKSTSVSSQTASTLKPKSDTNDGIQANPTSTSEEPTILDEHNLISRLSPLKRILCLCPVPLGRGRISWSGGDYLHYPTSHQDQSHPNNGGNLDESNQSNPNPPVRIRKYRYGERYAIGVAVSDPYLTHAVPVDLKGDRDGAFKNGFMAEIVPTFRCDAHNLGSAPIFHTNLPYFRREFLQKIGHYDIGGIMLALPMRPNLQYHPTTPYYGGPSLLYLDQEQKLEEARESLLTVLHQYVTTEEDYDDSDCDDGTENLVMSNGSSGNVGSLGNTRRRAPLGPLNLQGYIHERLSIADVLSKSNECDRNNSWEEIATVLRHIQHQQRVGESSYVGGYNECCLTIPPEIHAAVALNLMLEKYTSRFHNYFF